MRVLLSTEMRLRFGVKEERKLKQREAPAVLLHLLAVLGVQSVCLADWMCGCLHNKGISFSQSWPSTCLMPNEFDIGMDTVSRKSERKRSQQTISWAQNKNNILKIKQFFDKNVFSLDQKWAFSSRNDIRKVLSSNWMTELVLKMSHKMTQKGLWFDVFNLSSISTHEPCSDLYVYFDSTQSNIWGPNTLSITFKLWVGRRRREPSCQTSEGEHMVISSMSLDSCLWIQHSE